MNTREKTIYLDKDNIQEFGGRHTVNVPPFKHLTFAQFRKCYLGITRHKLNIEDIRDHWLEYRGKDIVNYIVVKKAICARYLNIELKKKNHIISSKMWVGRGVEIYLRSVVYEMKQDERLLKKEKRIWKQISNKKKGI